MAEDRIARRRRREQEIARRRRIAAIGGLLAFLVVLVVIILSAGGGGGSGQPSTSTSAAHATAAQQAHGAGGTGSAAPAPSGVATALPRGVAQAARAVSAPILMYHVINPPPSGAPFPGLYVPAGEFAEQMHALAGAGFHAVTLDQIYEHWSRGAPLPVKPVVITFDNGYQSQYTNALPVLHTLGWRAVENIQLTGLPPSQGGLSEEQVKGLVSAGWELDTQGLSHADLITLSAASLREQVIDSRRTIQQRYGVPVRWFCYPSGHYDATVVAAVKEAGYLGSTTVVPGWAAPSSDPYRLPRLRVLGGTSGTGLLELIASTEHNPEPPASYSG